MRRMAQILFYESRIVPKSHQPLKFSFSCKKNPFYTDVSFSNSAAFAAFIESFIFAQTGASPSTALAASQLEE